MEVYAVRGASGIAGDNPAAIRESVIELITRITEANSLPEQQLISIQFSITPDITAMNPASALRSIGYQNVPLFCCLEPTVMGSLPRMLRVLIHYRHTEDHLPQAVYINGAERLRPDLSGLSGGHPRI